VENTINYHKQYMFLFLLMFIVLSVNMVSAVKPITSVDTSDEGLIVEATTKDYIRTATDHEFEIHVFNKTDGGYIVSDTTCYMHLYHKDGNHVYEGVDNSVAHTFDYAFDLTGGNFSTRGEYQAKFQCNHTSGFSGGQEIFFWVNDYGEELTPANQSLFSNTMWFMIILFLLALVGIFSIENVVGKFACYWIAHIFFVVGTFSVWQFTQGYALAYFGFAGVWKVLFYVGIFSMLPMMILSIAGIISYYAMDSKVQKLIDKGMPEAEAYRRQGRKYK